jgi:hypothetical protein
VTGRLWQSGPLMGAKSPLDRHAEWLRDLIAVEPDISLSVIRKSSPIAASIAARPRSSSEMESNWAGGASTPRPSEPGTNTPNNLKKE